jgi:hypothetical protein
MEAPVAKKTPILVPLVWMREAEGEYRVTTMSTQ